MKRIHQCALCRHLIESERGRHWTCAAFPAGIPKSIITNRFVHDLPYPGDEGTRWEAASEAAGELWASLLERQEKRSPDWAAARKRAFAEVAAGRMTAPEGTTLPPLSWEAEDDMD